MSFFYLIVLIVGLGFLYIILKKEIKIYFQKQTQELIRQFTDFSQNEFYLFKKEILDNIFSQQDSFQKNLFEINKNFGEIQKTLAISLTQAETIFNELQKRAQDLASIKEIFQIPKLRGNLGEFLLEELLKSYLPNEYWQANYNLEGKRADFVIKIKERLLVIDSKFPLESFKRYLEDNNQKSEKEFLKSLKERIDEISTKYILPDKLTFPFAFMYIPADGIYYYLITQKSEIVKYAYDKNVIPVSPNTLYIYLQYVLLVLRGESLNKNVLLVLEKMGRINQDLEKILNDFQKIGVHLKDARNVYELCARKLSDLNSEIKFLNNLQTEAKSLFDSTSVRVKNENSN